MNATEDLSPDRRILKAAFIFIHSGWVKLNFIRKWLVRLHDLHFTWRACMTAWVRHVARAWSAGVADGGGDGIERVKWAYNEHKVTHIRVSNLLEQLLAWRAHKAAEHIETCYTREKLENITRRHSAFLFRFSHSMNTPFAYRKWNCSVHERAMACVCQICIIIIDFWQYILAIAPSGLGFLLFFSLFGAWRIFDIYLCLFFGYSFSRTMHSYSQTWPQSMMTLCVIISLFYIDELLLTEMLKGIRWRCLYTQFDRTIFV